MAELIAIIILISSFSGMVFIVFRKIPILLTLPETLPKHESLIFKLKNKLKRLNPFKNFSFEIFLQKIISRIRILSLKIDNYTFNLLKELREKSQNKLKKRDNYWEEIKKIKDKIKIPGREKKKEIGPNKLN